MQLAERGSPGTDRHHVPGAAQWAGATTGGAVRNHPGKRMRKGLEGHTVPKELLLTRAWGWGRLCPLCQDTLFYGKHISKQCFQIGLCPEPRHAAESIGTAQRKNAGHWPTEGGNQAQRAHKSCSQVSPVSGHDAETGDGHTAQIPQSSSGTERRRRAGTAPNSTSVPSSFRRL